MGPAYSAGRLTSTNVNQRQNRSVRGMKQGHTNQKLPIEKIRLESALNASSDCGALHT
jgi:hypothetical protein